MSKSALGAAAALVAFLPMRSLATDPNLCSPQRPDQCLNGVSGSVTSLDSLRASVGRPQRSEEERERRGQAGLRPVRVAASDQLSGVLGANSSGWSLWASASTADFSGSVPVAPWEGDLDAYTIGVDRLFGNRLTLGGALLNERMKTRTRFNGGGQNTDGTTVLAYGSYLLSDTFSIDGSIGRGWLDTSQNRIDPASAPGNPDYLVASYKSERTLLVLTLNASRVIGSVTLGTRAGYQNSREEQDGYRETGGTSARTVNDRRVSLEQGFIGADAAWSFHRNWQIYGSAMWRRDLSRDDGRSGGGLPSATGATTSSDRTEREWAAGLRFYAAARFTAVMEYLKTTGRDAYSHDAWMLMVRFEL